MFRKLLVALCLAVPVVAVSEPASALLYNCHYGRTSSYAWARCDDHFPGGYNQVRALVWCASIYSAEPQYGYYSTWRGEDYTPVVYCPSAMVSMSSTYELR